MSRLSRWHSSFILIYILFFTSMSVKSVEAMDSDASTDETMGLTKAKSLSKQGNTSEANAILRRLAAENPNYFEAHYNLGLSYAREKDYAKAEKYLRSALLIKEEKGTDDVKVYNALGWVLFSQYKYKEAENIYLDGIAANSQDQPTNKRLHINLGVLYYVTGDLVNARKQLLIAKENFGSDSVDSLLKQIKMLEAEQREKVATRNLQLSIEEGEYIGQRVWLNETGGKISGLINWNEGEGHASVGIGHFIWYPKDYEGRFKETFPSLLAYFEESGVTLPDWLIQENDCPWINREGMIEAKKNQNPKFVELEQFLNDTIPYQVEFLILRLQNSLPLMLDTINDEEKKKHISEQFNRISNNQNGTTSSDGVYALLDYVNFKGEGTNPNERYQDEGWGLLQVLEEIKDNGNTPLDEFVNSAKFVLNRRIENSPPSSNEERWRKGWFKRIETYSSSANNK